jgi:hypothetical protein
VRGAWGAVLLTDPGLPLRLGGGLDSPAVRWAVRLLGARHLVETIILSASHDDRPRRWILAVDGTHGLSMLVLAAVNSRLRRDALLSAASAAGLVALSWREGSVPSRRG